MEGESNNDQIDKTHDSDIAVYGDDGNSIEVIQKHLHDKIENYLSMKYKAGLISEEEFKAFCNKLGKEALSNLSQNDINLENAGKSAVTNTFAKFLDDVKSHNEITIKRRVEKECTSLEAQLQAEVDKAIFPPQKLHEIILNRREQILKNISQPALNSKINFKAILDENLDIDSILKSNLERFEKVEEQCQMILEESIKFYENLLQETLQQSSSLAAASNAHKLSYTYSKKIMTKQLEVLNVGKHVSEFFIKMHYEKIEDHFQKIAEELNGKIQKIVDEVMEQLKRNVQRYLHQINDLYAYCKDEKFLKARHHETQAAFAVELFQNIPNFSCLGENFSKFVVDKYFGHTEKHYKLLLAKFKATQQQLQQQFDSSIRNLIQSYDDTLQSLLQEHFNDPERFAKRAQNELSEKLEKAKRDYNFSQDAKGRYIRQLEEGFNERFQKRKIEHEENGSNLNAMAHKLIETEMKSFQNRMKEKISKELEKGKKSMENICQELWKKNRLDCPEKISHSRGEILKNANEEYQRVLVELYESLMSKVDHT